MEFTDCITGLQHIGVPTKDLPASIAFYKALGFEEILHTIQPNGLPVVFLQQKNMVMEVYQCAEAARRPGALDHVAIDVNDIEAACRLAQQKGFATLENDIQFLPFWENGVRYFTIEGPNREKIEFSQRL